MSSGTYEFDDRGRKLFKPDVPSFPTLDEVHDLLDPAMASVREFDRRLGAWNREAAVGRLFAGLDAVHSSAAEGSTTTFTDLMEYETSLRIAPNVDDAAVVAAVAALAAFSHPGRVDQRLEDPGIASLEEVGGQVVKAVVVAARPVITVGFVICRGDVMVGGRAVDPVLLGAFGV